MAIINHTYGLVFVHVPKNAGTSVSRYFSRLSTYRDLEIGATELGEAYVHQFSRRFKLRKHSTFREIRAVMGADVLATYTTVAVIRDPVERACSIFRFLNHWDQWRQLERWQPFIEDFDRHRKIEHFLASEFFAAPGPDRLFMPQVTWIANDTGEKLLVDRLLRLESLQQDMGRLVSDLDLPQDLLGDFDEHVNETDKAKRIRLDRASKARVRERYRQDYELLGYDQPRAGKQRSTGS